MTLLGCGSVIASVAQTLTGRVPSRDSSARDCWLGPRKPFTPFVAKNPDSASKLHYLIRLPLASGVLILKATEAWPARPRSTAIGQKPGRSVPTWSKRSPCEPVPDGARRSTWCWSVPARPVLRSSSRP